MFGVLKQRLASQVQSGPNSIPCQLQQMKEFGSLLHGFCFGQLPMKPSCGSTIWGRPTAGTISDLSCNIGSWFISEGVQTLMYPGLTL